MKGINSEDKRRLRVAVHARAGGVCAYCCRVTKFRLGTVDHYLPYALGGTNAQANLRWACRPCNEAKADMHPDEWEKCRPRPEPKRNVRVELLVEIARRAREARA